LIVNKYGYRYNVNKHNKGGKKMIGDNLYSLRKLHKLTQEEVSERVGVSRQALAKWESGETMPDIEKCMLLAELYNVTLDDLVNYTKDEMGLNIPPKGKYVFGVVTVGDKGQIVIPYKARKVFQIQSGDRFIVLGDEYQGIALIKESNFLNMINEIRKEGEQYE
jgi:AbrB family looped-hinge helix DNA binding protein